MALTDDELDKIKLLLRSELKPFEILVRQHDQTLYGVDHNNGMNATVQQLIKFKYILIGATIVIGSATFWQIVRLIPS